MGSLPPGQANSSANAAALLEFYRRCRYYGIVCAHLMKEAGHLENWVKWSVLASLGIALLGGVWPGAMQMTPRWIWDLYAAVAALLGVYAAVEGSSRKLYQYHGLTLSFLALAEKLEHLALLDRLGNISALELENSWQRYKGELDGLRQQAGPEFVDYENKHREVLTAELDKTLKDEGRMG
jgi:hypothetical protein